ncbi:ABC transporter substrate-binding protein [Lachnobacterium bovis]|uniref:ABC transporter substrate-binding protein n=1 Tax=Lachnobacterium bovis TaxID=140626 RepID=UPI0003B3C17D|nr:ABC transporter substrate-binding protein [Lachnobacterium bovis]
MKLKNLSRSIALVSILSISCSLFGGCSLKNGSSQKQSFNNDAKYKVGICQFVKHPALDRATKGFKDYLTKKLGDDVTFDEQNAQGDAAVCTSITTTFTSNKYDLILANATPALQAASASTNKIPILGTSVTDYATALGIDSSKWSGNTGKNISGTSDLAPLSDQADCVKELFPKAKTVGILYCSSEANSAYQAKEFKKYIEKYGYVTKDYLFNDSNDVASVAKTACDNSDILYIPTDNTAASCAEAINNVALPAKTPIFCGEEGICKGCGVATLSIDYYDLGVQTGKLAYKVLKEKKNPKTLKIEYATKLTKEYNEKNCKKLGIKIPKDYKKIKK